MKHLAILISSLLLAAPSAFADTFNFTFVGTPASGSGQFTASPTVYGTGVVPAFLVNTVSGTATFNGQPTAIVSIAALGAGFQGNDNILFFPGVNGNDFFDGHGTAFVLGNGVIVDLYAVGGIYLTVPGQSNLSETGSVNVTAATPEPASLVLIATGCLGLAGAIRRRISRP